jgi:pimeloyl-ACP methyl ester carboxylesterase
LPSADFESHFSTVEGLCTSKHFQWRSKPSSYLVATDDKMIPPAAQRMMASRAGSQVTEAPGSHAIYVSNPEVIAAVIKQAAEKVAGSTR